MMQHNTHFKVAGFGGAAGVVTCSRGEFNGDPNPGYYKHCYCVPTSGFFQDPNRVVVNLGSESWMQGKPPNFGTDFPERPQQYLPGMWHWKCSAPGDGLRIIHVQDRCVDDIVALRCEDKGRCVA